MDEHDLMQGPEAGRIVLEAVVSRNTRLSAWPRRLRASGMFARTLPGEPNALPTAAAGDAPARPGRLRGEPLLTWTLVLAAVCLAAKLALLPFPVSNLSELARWLLRLAIVAAPDMCFVMLLGLGCLLVSAVLGRWPGLEARVWRPACLLGYILAALYAVASVPMYKVTMVPFTVRLLSFAGGPEAMVSSIAPYVPPGIVAGLVAAPLAVALAACAAWRWPRCRVRMPLGWGGLAVSAALVAAYWATCRVYVEHSWTDRNRWERRIAQSPHGVLILSAARELLSNRPFTQNYSFEQVDASDFRQPEAETQPDGAARLFAAGAARPKNVILVVMESIGVEYFGVSGSRFATTPRLDRLAARQGVVFENAYVQAVSSCKSLVSLSASVYPRPDWLLIVRDHADFDVPTIAEVLDGRGYRTCYAHSGYWGWQRRDRFLANRGVDHLFGAKDRPDRVVNSWGIDDKTMFQAVLDWIDREPGAGFFAFAYTIETHHPYVAPERLHDFGVDDEQLATYLNAVRAADAHIGWLIDELARRGLADSTLVVVTSDHGESFGQHNQRVHSFGVYEQTVHVPLLVLHPSLAELPRRNAALAQHIDIAPTILDLLGIPAPAEWQGRSLFSGPPRERAYFLAVGNEVVLGLRDGRFKYHYYVDTTREELFDLEADPGELTNLADCERDRCRSYRSRLGGMVAHQRAYLARHGVE
ncbi:MAG: sulfatase [Pirellulales bacterium]